MEKYTLQTAIETIQQFASTSNEFPLKASIFTAQDVLNILQGIELPEAKPNRAHIPSEWATHFVELLIDDIDERDLIDYDSAEFNIRYNNELELENVNIDTYLLRKRIQEALESACQGVNDEIIYQEERDKEKLEEQAEDTNSEPESDSNC